eukprot:1354576-Amorphochlora_amoeboformis.AAC.1
MHRSLGGDRGVARESAAKTVSLVDVVEGHTLKDDHIFSSEMATKLEQKISVPLTQFYNDAELKRKIIIKDEKKYGVEMNRAKLGVQKNLRNCQKLINSCIAAKAEEEEKKKSPQGKKPKKKFGGIMSWVNPQFMYQNSN